MDPIDESTTTPSIPQQLGPDGLRFVVPAAPTTQKGNGSGSSPTPPIENEVLVVMPNKGDGHSVARIDPDASPSTYSATEHQWLDADHQDLVQRVLDKDTGDTRRELAARLTGALTSDIGSLRRYQDDIGSAEQIDAIRATGWCGWARFFVVAAWLIAAIDALVWAFGAARVLSIK